MGISALRKTRLLLPAICVLALCFLLGCTSGEQHDEDLVTAVSLCTWNAAHADRPARISNDWLTDKVLMDFLHAGNLGSEVLLYEAARNEVSGYDTFEDFRVAIQELASNGYAGKTPNPVFLEHVPHPRNPDEQGTLIILYLHLFHCRDYWHGTEATKVPKYDDALSDMSECYWRKVRVERLPIPPTARKSAVDTAKRADYVAAFQVDGVFRSAVYAFRDFTPEMVVELESSPGFCG